jgi:hypothetical protein
VRGAAATRQQGRLQQRRCLPRRKAKPLRLLRHGLPWFHTKVGPVSSAMAHCWL